MKSRGVAVLLALFLGGLGVHKFYLDRVGLGLLYLIFSCTFIPMLLALVDTFVLLVISEDEFNRTYNSRYFNS